MALDFAEFIKEREQIRIKKERGDPYPWTDDPILRNYKFCNVRREDDRGTRWLIEKLVPFWGAYYEMLPVSMLYRQYSTPEAGDLLLPRILNRPWNTREAVQGAVSLGAKFTSAYQLNGRAGETRVETTIRRVDTALSDRFEVNRSSIADTCERLRTWYEGTGTFFSWQICLDLSYTPWLSGAIDLATWAQAGAGAARGLARVLGKRVRWQEALAPMRVLADELGLRVSDVEHALCEFDKYERIRLGEGSGRKYKLSRLPAGYSRGKVASLS